MVQACGGSRGGSRPGGPYHRGGGGGTGPQTGAIYIYIYINTYTYIYIYNSHENSHENVHENSHESTMKSPNIRLLAIPPSCQPPRRPRAPTSSRPTRRVQATEPKPALTGHGSEAERTRRKLHFLRGINGKIYGKM